MFEIERQAYLKSLGIVQYVSQNPIAGAMESPILDDEQIYPPHYFSQPEESAPDLQTQNEYLTGAQTSQAPAAQQQPVQSQPQAPVQKQNTEAPTRQIPTEPISTEGLTVNIPKELLSEEVVQKRNVSNEQKSSMLEFCFAWVETKRGVSLLIDLSDPGVKDLSAKEHRLMGDIYHALQIPAEEIRYQYFKWPLVNNPKIKQGENEARETLLGYLEGKVSNTPASSLILIGDLTGKILGQQSQQIQIAGQQLMTALIPSLTAMMSDWQNKAKAWRLLAPLRGRTF